MKVLVKEGHIKKIIQSLFESYNDVNVDFIKKNTKKLNQYENFSDIKKFDDITLLNFKNSDDDWFLWGKVIAFNNDDLTEIANASYGKINEYDLLKASIDVRPDMRRKGIASKIYEWIEELTNETLFPDIPHTKDAEKLWSNPNRKFGIKENLDVFIENSYNDDDLSHNKHLARLKLCNIVNNYDNYIDLLKKGGFDYDLIDIFCFGFSDETLNKIDPKILKIIWKDDLENVKYEISKSGLSLKKWSEKIDLSEPIDVDFNGKNFILQDGHHRYVAAKTLNKMLNMNLTIKANPLKKIGNINYDEFHELMFKSCKK